MDNPKKLIYKYNNLNKRIQYQLFIFVGSVVEDNIKKILNKIKNLNFFDSLITLSNEDFKQLNKYYGDVWYNKFFISHHLHLSINLIHKNSGKRKDIEKKFGKEWYAKHIAKIVREKKMHSYSFLFKKEREMKERKFKIRKAVINENDDISYKTNKMSQFGGNGETSEESESVSEKTLEVTANIDDDAEEFDLDELENMHNEMDKVDANIENTSKMIDKILEKEKKNITSYDSVVPFPEYKNDLMYDDSLKNVFKKTYVYSQYIYSDDTISKIKDKITCSIKLNNIFVTGGNIKHNAYILPSRIYLWSEYNFIDQIDNTKKSEKIMLGHKWIKRHELLNIDVEPNSNIRIYENLKGPLKNLRTDMRKYGSRIKMENDTNNLFEDYSKYVSNNEIYMIDIYSQLGVNYEIIPSNVRHVFDVYIKIYFPQISSEQFTNIINYLNTRGSEENRNIEIKHMNYIYKSLNNDFILENEIIKTITEVKLKSDKYSWMFKDNYITHSVIHSYLNYENVYGNDNIDLFRIFDNFILSEKYPFLQFQLPDGKMIYKFYDKNVEEDKNAILSKWFESSPYGISFKIKVKQKGDSSNKYIAINLNDIGRLQYKIQWKEEDEATINDIKSTYAYIQNLIEKINDENTKLKIAIPNNNDFQFAFINSIQKFTIGDKNIINHNDLSNFSRYFYPYVALVIEPRKRQSKFASKASTSKFGTYLRYKRVTKYENKSKIEHRIIYFMRNYEYTDKELVKEISKQFNITDSQSVIEIENVKKRYPVIKKSRKNLKKIQHAPKYKPPGIDLNIQGKSRHNYKIRISGARGKVQLNRIISFTNILIYLYTETYIKKNKNYQKIKEKLKLLNKVAKRRNKVQTFTNIDDMVEKEIKLKTKKDKSRIGFRPTEGISHWTRNCQNSGKDKRRQPTQFDSSNIADLSKKGYKHNKKTGFYERTAVYKGKKITIRAAAMDDLNNKSNTFYYTCDPEINGQHTFIDFLSKSNHPDGECMPCCFKKDPLLSKNKERQNYFMECVGKKEKKQVKTKIKELDKIYILQDTNKIQEGKFGKLPYLLDVFLNNMNKNKIIISNRYLIKTESEYLLKYGVKLSEFPFLYALGIFYNLSIDEIKKVLIEKLEKDKNDLLFTTINSGDIRTQFKTRENFINFIKTNEYLGYDIISDFVSKKNVLSENGINLYIFEKKVQIIKKELEKNKITDDYILKCNKIENDIFLDDKSRDSILMLKDNNVYYPIFIIQKKNQNDKISIVKIIKNNKIIDHCNNYYKLGCNRNIISELRKGLLYNSKFVSHYLNELSNKKFNVKTQIIDLRNKCRYLVLNNGISVPVYPSGTLELISIEMDINKYLYGANKTLDNLLLIDKQIPSLDYKPIGILYNNKKNRKYSIVGFMLSEEINCKVNSQYITEESIKLYAKKCGRKEFIKRNVSIDEYLDKAISKGKSNYIVDNRIKDVNLRKFNNESYELFRYELSNYLKEHPKLKNQIIDIIKNEKLKNNQKKQLIKNFLFKNLNKQLYNLYQKGGQIGGSSFMTINNKIEDLENYIVPNIRDLCSTNNKNTCANAPHCKWHSGECKFKISDENFIKFINKISEELIKDELKSKEILLQENYYVSDIVNNNVFLSRPNQKIIKSDSQNIKDVFSNIFGKDNIPTIGKKKTVKLGKTMHEENLDNPVVKLSNMLIQNIIPNDNSIIRAFINGIYWVNNRLLDDKQRNLGYFSTLQTVLTNFFKGNIIDFLNNINNKQYIKNTFGRYFDGNIENYISEMSNNNTIVNNGIIELATLSRMNKVDVIIYNNYNKIIYYIKKGQLEFDSNYSKKSLNKVSDFKNNVNIMYEYSNSKIPTNVKIIYYCDEN